MLDSPTEKEPRRAGVAATARARSVSAASWAYALLGVAAALGPALWLWGFTVDDALITARYAANIANGAGYRFNAAGASTDGVTPLGLPYLLAPFASAGPLAALQAARWVGAIAWVAASGLLAVAIGRSSARRVRWLGLLLVATSAPLGAWCGAGMETGLVTALTALALSLPPLGRPLLGAACVGAAAALRPEMLPFAALVGAAAPLAPAASGGRARLRSRALAAALATAPFALVALTRAAVFGSAAPLAALAKPADAVLGFRYALACALLAGPIALVAPLAFRRLAPWPRWLVVAVAAHLGAVAFAGGDWMPLSRLVVPALPAVALAAAHLASVGDARFAALRTAVALAGQLFVAFKMGPVAAGVMADRESVRRELAPHLEGARVVAALDVGWVGAATGATVVDLAGVTDPAIAAMPGGHTSKRLPPSLLDGRGVDAIVLLLSPDEELAPRWSASRFARHGEAWIARLPSVERGFAPVATSSLPHLRYVVLRRRGEEVAGAALSPIRAPGS